VTAIVKDVMRTPESAVVGHEIVADARHVEGVVAVRDPPVPDDYGAPY